MKCKKIFAFALVGALLLTGCGSAESAAETDAKKQMKEAVSYYSDEFVEKIPDMSSNQDVAAMTAELEAAIEQSNTYVDLFLTYMDDTELSEDSQEAAMNLKTAYYGVQTTALEPMLEIMKTNEGEAPDYATIVTNAQTTYVDTASDLLK